MIRSQKFLMRPTGRQVAALTAMLEDHRQLYNAALEERRESWRKGVSMNYYRQAIQLPDIRKADPDGQGRWSAGSQQQTLRRLDKSFANFFRRVKAGAAPGYPRFKGRGFDSVEWPARKNGATWDSVPHETVTRVYLLGVGHIKVHQHRAVKGRIKTIRARREAGRWYVIVCCDDIPAEPLSPAGKPVGVDLGIEHFATLSDGGRVENQRFLRASAGRLADAQRDLARKTKGSNRRKTASRKVAKVHRKIRAQRLDHAHKTALDLVRKYDFIAHEVLPIKYMSGRPKPKPDPENPGTYLPNGAAAKGGLNKSVQDAGWGMFLDILRAKAESAGRVVVGVDHRYTSQRCAGCGHIARGNRVSQAVFRCLACGHEAHADVNAAVNILRAGLILQEARAA